jgi:hypothetical protein
MKEAANCGGLYAAAGNLQATVEIGTVFGMQDPERARYAFNGRHPSTFGLRRCGEARAPALHAVKSFGPSIDHWMQSPFLPRLILW